MKQHFSKQRNQRKTHLDVHVSIWSIGLSVLNEPLFIMPIKCWIIFLTMKSKKRGSIRRRRRIHFDAKKNGFKNGSYQGSKEILREMDKWSLKSLEKCFFFIEEMVRGRRKNKVKMRVKSVNGGRIDEGGRSKKERDKESGGPKFDPHIKMSWVAESTQ